MNPVPTAFPTMQLANPLSRELKGGITVSQSSKVTNVKSAAACALPSPIAMLGVPFDKVTVAETLRVIGRIIESGQPHYAATANVDFVVQALGDVELRRILADADLVVCDGMPLVWASRFLGNALPERVAGSDLVPTLLGEAERHGWRVFFLGGTDESVARAAENVRQKHPNLQLVGAYSPPFKPLLEMDHEDILRRVRAARPDILLVAFGCPKQEKWISMHFKRAGVPLSVGVGATIDFLGGSVRRAPQWMQRTGLEWIFRLAQEPRRLFRRYVTGLWVFGGAILRQWWHLRGIAKDTRGVEHRLPMAAAMGHFEVVPLPPRVDAALVAARENDWSRLASQGTHILLDVSRVTFIDSTGVGMLVRLQKHLRAKARHLILVRPSKELTRALALMRFTEFFPTADDLESAQTLVEARLVEENVIATDASGQMDETLAWQGDIIAANAEEVGRATLCQIERFGAARSRGSISLAGVRFIDSTGVRWMVRVRQEAAKRGVQVRFSDPQPTVHNVLRMLRMENLLNF